MAKSKTEHQLQKEIEAKLRKNTSQEVVKVTEIINKSNNTPAVSGIGEAPMDGQDYVRNNGLWIPASLGSGSGDMETSVYDPATKAEQVITISDIVDEDDMSSDSDILIPTQQSVKAYVDSKSGLSTRTLWIGPADFEIRSGASSLMFGTQRIRLWSFSGSANNQILGTFMLPKDYSSGSLTLTIYYANTGTNGNTMVWNYLVTQLNTNQSLDSLATEQNIPQTFTPSTTQYALTSAVFTTTITVDGAKLPIFTLMIQRIATDANDTNTSAMYLAGVTITYTSTL